MYIERTEQVLPKKVSLESVTIKFRIQATCTECVQVKGRFRCLRAFFIPYAIVVIARRMKGVKFLNKTMSKLRNNEFMLQVGSTQSTLVF